MALETNYPKPAKPKKGPLPKDTLPAEHDTTSGATYGTTEGVKESNTSFEQVEVPKKEASNVDEDAPVRAAKKPAVKALPAKPAKAVKATKSERAARRR